MKQFYFFITTLLAVSQMSAQTPDTVTVINQPNQVIITETPNGTVVKVNGVKDNNEYNYTYQMDHNANDSIHTTQNMDWELNYPFKKDKKAPSHWTIETKGLYFGGGLKTSYGQVNNSFNWGILQVVGINYNTLHGQNFSFGVGFDEKRFSLKRPNCFEMDEETNKVDVVTDFYPDGARDRSSAFTVRAIQFPLLFEQKLGKDFHITLGASMNWNAYAFCNTRYKINKTEYDVSYHGIKQNKITFDLIGAFSFDGLAIYCRYTPSNMFKKGFGPEIKNTWMLGGAIFL